MRTVFFLLMEADSSKLNHSHDLLLNLQKLLFLHWPWRAKCPCNARTERKTVWNVSTFVNFSWGFIPGVPKPYLSSIWTHSERIGKQDIFSTNSNRLVPALKFMTSVQSQDIKLTAISLLSVVRSLDLSWMELIWFLTTETLRLSSFTHQLASYLPCSACGNKCFRTFVSIYIPMYRLYKHLFCLVEVFRFTGDGTAALCMDQVRRWGLQNEVVLCPSFPGWIKTTWPNPGPQQVKQHFNSKQFVPCTLCEIHFRAHQQQRVDCVRFPSGFVKFCTLAGPHSTVCGKRWATKQTEPTFLQILTILFEEPTRQIQDVEWCLSAKSFEFALVFPQRIATCHDIYISAELIFGYWVRLQRNSIVPELPVNWFTKSSGAAELQIEHVRNMSRLIIWHVEVQKLSRKAGKWKILVSSAVNLLRCWQLENWCILSQPAMPITKML